MFSGNNMFGHHLLPSHGHSSGSGFGSSHGNSSFGSGHQQSSFGKGSHGDGMGMQGGVHGYGGHYGHHGLYNRQSSLLEDMTHSKKDGAKPWIYASYSMPHGYHEEGLGSLFSKPLEHHKKKKLEKQQSMSEDPDGSGNLLRRSRAPSFASNPEKMRSRTVSTVSAPPAGYRPPLNRGISIADEWLEPVNMDLHRPELKRRNTIAFDKARKRQDSISKPRKSLLPLNGLVSKLSRRRSSKYKDKDRDSKASNSDCGSITPGRSRSNTVESEIVGPSRPRSSTRESIDSKISQPSYNRDSEGRNSSTFSDTDTNQEKLILSLMNPDVGLSDNENVFEPPLINTEPKDEYARPPNGIRKNFRPSYLDEPLRDLTPLADPYENILESPTSVSKRFHKQLLPPSDSMSINSMNSGRFTPRSYTSSRRSQSPTRSVSSRTSSQRNTLPYKPGQKLVMYVDPSDSDNSEYYYDCPTHNSASSSSVPENALIPRRGKKRTTKRPRNTSTSSCCTDGEDTTSTCDSPLYMPGSFQNGRPNYDRHYANDPESEDTPTEHETSIHNTATLPLRGVVYKIRPDLNGAKPAIKPKPQLAAPISCVEPPNSLPITTIASVIKEPLRNNYENVGYKPAVIVPQYAQVLKSDPEPESKDSQGNETGTADSSESGYATSHVQLSPRDYEKVSSFVNSLPYNPDMAEIMSEASHDGMLMNGSETDSNNEDEEIYSPISDISNIVCKSGSDTDNMSIESGSNISMSKLEVMKILESPTDVRARVENDIAERSARSSLSGDRSLSKSSPRDKNSLPKKGAETEIDNDNPTNGSKLRKGSNASETELLHLLKSSGKDETDNVSRKSQRSSRNVDAKCVVLVRPGNSDNGSNTETQLYSESNRYNSFFDRPLLSFTGTYTATYESKFTKCIDMCLHMLNLLLFLSSAGVIAVGLWLLLKDFNINHITEILGNNLLQIIVYMSIAGAGTALLAAACLCCGIRQDKVGLGFYAFTLVAVIIAFATAAVLSIIFVDKLGGIDIRFDFEDRLKLKYGINSENGLDNMFFTDSWDIMQKEFECCGAEGNANSTVSWAVYKKFSKWYRQQPFKATIYVPESCCKKDTNIEVCQGSNHNLLGPPVYGPPLDRYYPHKNPNLNTNGCYEFLSGYLSKLAKYVALTTGGLAGLYFLVVMLTWVFCFKKSQDFDESYFTDSEYELDEHDGTFTGYDMDGKPIRTSKDMNDIEETKFMSTPMKSMLKPSSVTASREILELENKTETHVREDMKQNSSYNIETTPNISEQNGYIGIHSKRRNSSEDNKDYDYEGGDSNYDDHGYHGNSSPEPEDQIDRRNRWMHSQSSGHLLSTAIEEEDSNFEDSDNEKTSAFV